MADDENAECGNAGIRTLGFVSLIDRARCTVPIKARNLMGVGTGDFIEFYTTEDDPLTVKIRKAGSR